MWPFKTRDFRFQRGAIQATSRGAALLAAISELMKTVLPRVRILTLDELSRLGMDYASNEEALNARCIALTFAYVWDAAAWSLGREQGSLLVDGLFFRTYGRYPTTEEAFHSYANLPAFRADGNKAPAVKKPECFKPLRLHQFMEDTAGTQTMGALVALGALLMIFSLDCRDLIKTRDPMIEAQSLAASLDSRLSDFFQRAGKAEKGERLE